MTHSPEPWRRGHSSSSGDLIYDAEDEYVGAAISEEDQKRIVACVNFCQHLSNDTIQSLLDAQIGPATVLALAKDLEWSCTQDGDLVCLVCSHVSPTHDKDCLLKRAIDAWRKCNAQP